MNYFVNALAWFVNGCVAGGVAGFVLKARLVAAEKKVVGVAQYAEQRASAKVQDVGKDLRAKL